LKSLNYILTFVIIFLFSCKKYEDGPGLSFHSKTERIANHWKYEKKYLNEEETDLSDEEKNTTLTFDKGGSFVKRVPNGSYFTSYDGNWEFIEKKEKIKTHISYSYFGNPATEEISWEILKLKEKELWLAYTNTNDDRTEIHLIPE
jgi:hypothetical protein